MIPPLCIDDLADRITNKGGSYYYSFNRAKAAKSILAKLPLAVEAFDAKEDKPELWFFEDGFWHPGGAQLLTHIIDEVAENHSDSENINDVLRRIRGTLRLKPVEFDISHPYLVGCSSGIVVDLRTRQARKAVPGDLISMPIPVNYDPEARCPDFIRFLKDTQATDEDILTVIDFLASLLIVIPMDYFICAPGLGSNGRTTIKNLIRHFVGSDACRSIPLKDLSNRFTSGFLLRCRVNFCSETEISAVVLDFIKRCSEKMPVEQKFKGMLNALLYLKFFFDSNVMPSIPDSSYGAERRLVRLDMPWRYCDAPNPEDPIEKQKDPKLLAKLVTPEELSGILNLALERTPTVLEELMVYDKNQFGLSEYSLQSRSGDVFLQLFVEVTGNEADKIFSTDLRECYLDYCTVTNSAPLSRKSLISFIENETRRLRCDIRVGDKVSKGYSGLKFKKDIFDDAIKTLREARTAKKPVFQVLLDLFPNLRSEYATFRTKPVTSDLKPTESIQKLQEQQKSYTNTTISNLIVAYVAKYGGESSGEDESAGKKDPGRTPREIKSATKATKATTPPTDSDSDVALCSSLDPEVEEFLQDGGKASLERFMKEFPEATS